METIPKPSEQAIRARFDARTWQRGRAYARDGAIVHARKQGMILKASCIGSRPEPYQVEVTFNGRGIADTACSCPVGEEGDCKHIAALLVVWLNQPQTFSEAEEPKIALARRDKDELIALIKQMIRRYPDLESLLDLPIGGRGQSVNRETFHRQVAIAFQRGGYEWGAEAKITRDLLPLIEIAEDFLRRRDYPNAVASYEAISSAVLEHYGRYNDENGDLQGILSRCVEGMIDALSGLTLDATTRAAILPALFAIYRHDMDSGRDVLSDEIASQIVDHLTAEERQALAGWVREALPKGNDFHATYRRRAYGTFLMDLEADELDDETFIHLCRETSRTRDLVERLLLLQRAGEAECDAREVHDYELLGLADLFVEHGHGEVAERLIHERSADSQDGRLLEWLKSYYAAHGNETGALDLAITLFRMRPNFGNYQETRTLAQKTGRWEPLHAEFIALLKQTHSVSVLVAVYLDEGELDRAIDCVLEPRGAKSTAGFGSLYGPMYDNAVALTVAKAVETARPRNAREIYERHVKWLIAGRSRERYREACTYLVTIRELYDRLDEYEQWQRYLTGLREEYRTLRALKEEMTAAGLLD